MTRVRLSYILDDCAKWDEQEMMYPFNRTGPSPNQDHRDMAMALLTVLDLARESRDDSRMIAYWELEEIVEGKK